MPEYQNCFSVSSLNTKIRYLIEGDLTDIWVQGEISNFHHHPGSGHMYFTIKDSKSELRCAMFKGRNSLLQFKPTDGMNIRLFGTVTVYEERGQIQLVASKIELDGEGGLYKTFEKLKKTLANEGLFDSKYKKSLPLYPKKVGIITSASGAAFQDILNVLSRRAPHVDILIQSVKVQGIGAAEQIVDAITLFNLHGNVDILILGRGGGSIEDLWAFNDENVARSIFKSSIPIISAIGHETDFTIADFVSDLRAPTPSSAAELATSSMDNLLIKLSEIENRLINCLRNKIERLWMTKDQLDKRIVNQKPKKKILRQVEQLNLVKKRLLNCVNQKNTDYVNHLESISKQIISLGPRQVLKRGYSIPLDKSGEIIRYAKQVSIGDFFSLMTAKGIIGAKKTSDILDD